MAEEVYVHGQPVTGFTLILDGDEEAIKAIWHAAVTEMSKQYDWSVRERLDVIENLGWYLTPRPPVRGELRLRTRQPA